MVSFAIWDSHPYQSHLYHTGLIIYPCFVRSLLFLLRTPWVPVVAYKPHFSDYQLSPFLWVDARIEDS